MCIFTFLFRTHDNKVEIGLIDIIDGVTSGSECDVPLGLSEILVRVHKAKDLNT